jgi:hypothetical protein
LIIMIDINILCHMLPLPNLFLRKKIIDMSIL